MSESWINCAHWGFMWMKLKLAEYLEKEIPSIRNKKGLRRLISFIRAMRYSPSENAAFLLRYCYVYMGDRGVRKILVKRFKRLLVNRYGIHFNTGPNSYIGCGLFLPHPSSIVFGEGACLGDNCIVYQNVTFGAKRRKSKPDQEGRLYPVAGNDCIFYAGAVIIGPIRIADGSSVGANSVLITDTERNGVYAGVPAVRKG